jgi:hypothetical protein
MSANAEAAVTALIIETFRLNGRLLAAGDALVAEVPSLTLRGTWALRGSPCSAW